jgi:hypothetical protein
MVVMMKRGRGKSYYNSWALWCDCWGNLLLGSVYFISPFQNKKVISFPYDFPVWNLYACLVFPCVLQGECSVSLNFFVMQSTQLLHTIMWKCQSLFHTTAGVWTGDFLRLYLPENAITIFLSFFLHPLPYSMPSFPNMTVLQRLCTSKSATGS